MGNFPYAFSTPSQPGGEDSRELAMERIAAALSGAPQCFEWRHCRADGTRFDAEVTLNRVDLPGEVLVLGTVRDVSNRKRVEEELLQSRERLSLALESSRAGIWDRNVVENRSKWDDYHHLLFGLAPGSYSGNPNDFFSMIHPDDRERVKREMTAAINGDADYSTTYRVIWPDASVHFLADRGKVHRDGTGRAVRMIGISWDISELKQAEEALKESQQQLENIINFLPDATFVIDKEGKVIAWNRAIEEMTGIKGEEMLGKGNYEYALPFHGERRPILVDLVLQRHEGVESRYDSIQRKESGVSGEAYMPALPGGEVYLFGTASILKDSQGNVVGAIESIRDITERKRAQEELDRYRGHLEDLVAERTDTLAKVNEELVCEIEERKKAEQAWQESQQMLQLVLDTIPARVFWKDLDSTYLGCNRPFALDAGLHSPEEIIGKVDFGMGWVEEAEGYRADDRLVMETGRPKLGYEEPLTTSEGKKVWLRTNKVPLFDAGGKIKGVLGTYEDISESKRMVEALRASETRYRIVADNTYDWEYWLSPERQFLYTSPSCQRISGYTASEFGTDPELLSHIVHADDLTRFEAHLRQDEMTYTDSELEFRIIRKDGTTRWLGHVCQPVFDTHGSYLGRRGSSRDITDRKQVEQALQDSSQKLKHFAYSVAHDLKSPAVGVYGLTKRLAKHARDVLDEKGMSYCDQILKASEHIAALVDKVNVYIATKEARLSFERINISEILQMLKDEFSAQLSLRQIDWLEPATRVVIEADRMCMVRAFRNFVDNSLKYGGERLSKIWTGYEETEDFHVFSFSDDGKGLKEEGSEKIFEAFQRNETSRGVEGTGLGLTIVREIAEQHGGKVWVEPRNKKGVTFYISISRKL
jgi:PAS domain S-box-containing protein